MPSIQCLCLKPVRQINGLPAIEKRDSTNKYTKMTSVIDIRSDSITRSTHIGDYPHFTGNFRQNENKLPVTGTTLADPLSLVRNDMDVWIIGCLHLVT